MVTREMMGLLCLGSVWLAALLVAGAAWQDLRDILALRRRARRAMRAVVHAGEGEGGKLASWWVEQRGRALDGAAPAIAFHDRAFHSSVHGGSVRVGEAVCMLEGPCEVWPSRDARVAAAACHDALVFEGAYAQATRAAGYAREVRIAVSEGDDLFVLGEVVDGKLLGRGGPLVIATFDPAPQLTRWALAIFFFVPAELAACGLVTWVALRPPYFGAVGILGAILCLAFYLGVTPLAVALREHVRRPGEAYVRGTWRCPTA